MAGGGEWLLGDGKMTKKSKQSSRKRAILSTAFVPSGTHWLYYKNAWAKGVLVSADERELFLSFCLRRFRQAIAGRQATAPRRPYFRALRRLLAATLMGRDSVNESNFKTEE